MKRRYLNIATADWLANAKLRRAGHYLKGVWFDILCLMNDSDEVGVLRWSAKEIAAAVGCQPEDVAELLRLGIIKGIEMGGFSTIEKVSISKRNLPPQEVILLPPQPAPIYYSSRMILDNYKANSRGKHGYKSLCVGVDKKEMPPISIEDKGGISWVENPFYNIKEEKKERDISPHKVPPLAKQQPENGFAEFWELYPHTAGSKKTASESYAKALKRGAVHEKIISGVKEYVGFIGKTSTPVAYASTWLNQERWATDYNAAFEQWQRSQRREKPTTSSTFRDAWASVADGDSGDAGR